MFVYTGVAQSGRFRRISARVAAFAELLSTSAIMATYTRTLRRTGSSRSGCDGTMFAVVTVVVIVTWTREFIPVSASSSSDVVCSSRSEEGECLHSQYSSSSGCASAAEQVSGHNNTA